jgi:mRNA-degrading endonuclease toxin of MazEF toxin-antitoxin module
LDKDFDGWNIQKKVIEDRSADVLFHASEIWWCSVGINIATESCGKGSNFRRPVLVLRKLSRSSFIGIPLTSQPKTGTWFAEISVHGEPRWALLYQIRMFSTNRLQRRMTTLEAVDMVKIKQNLETLLELSNSSPEPEFRIGG